MAATSWRGPDGETITPFDDLYERQTQQLYTEAMMLVVTRKKEETVDLILEEPLPAGSVITVKVTRVGHTQCRLGIDAPESVKILRTELLEKDSDNDE